MSCLAVWPVCARADAARDTLPSVRTPFSWTVAAGIGFPVAPELIHEAYEPGFGIGIGIERPALRHVAFTANLDYMNLPFDSGNNPFDYGQQLQATQGQLGVLDFTLGTRFGPPVLHGRVGFGGSVIWGQAIAFLAPDANGSDTLRVQTHDPSGSGLALRAAAGTMFTAAKQRYFVELGWSLAQAEDRIQQIALRAGALFP